MYEFCYSDKTKESLYFNCIKCRYLHKKYPGRYGSIPRITVRNGRFVTDPDRPTSNHYCDIENDDDATIGATLAKREMHDVRDNIRLNKRKPKSEFEEAVKRPRLDAKYRNESESVKQSMEAFIADKGYESKRSGLSKARNKDIIRNVTVDNIPTEFQLTFRGRMAIDAADDEWHDEQFLDLCDNTDRRQLLVFCAECDVLSIMKLSESHAIEFFCDGDHKYNPPAFTKPGQLYTIHILVGEESFPILFALTQKSELTDYTKIFNCLRSKFESFDAVRIVDNAVWHSDFELAAINACRNIFPQSTIRGCYFHWTQALKKRIEKLKLADFIKDNAEAKSWFKRLKSCAFLPMDVVDRFLPQFFYERPITGINAIDAAMQLFIDYFQSTWIDGSLRPYWSQFRNYGRYTTNAPEGWHNGLHSRFDKQHPQLSEMIDFFQTTQNAGRIRLDAFAANKIAVSVSCTKNRSIQLRNEVIANEMRLFDVHMTNIFGQMPTTIRTLLYIDKIVRAFNA